MRKYLALIFITISCFTSLAQENLTLDTLKDFKNIKFLHAHGKNFDTVTYSRYAISKVVGEPYYQIDKEINSYWDMDLIYGAKINNVDTLPQNQFFPPIELINSEEISYSLNNRNYKVLKHIDRNCYDPLCGSRHSHVTHITGVTYFSPDFGILFRGRNGNVTLEMMVSIEGTVLPRELIIQILKEQNISDEIIEKYKSL